MRKTLKMTAFAAMTAFTVIATGCSGSTQMGPGMPDPGSPGEQPGPNPSPGPKPSPNPSPAPASANYSGAYAGSSPIDLTQNGVLPGVMGPILGALSRLHSCPGPAMLQLVEVASPSTFDYTWTNPTSGCPTTSSFVGNLLAGALTSVMQSQLYANVPVLDKIVDITEGITEMFRLIEIREKITIGAPSQAMAVNVEQQVTHIAFTTFGAQTVAPLAANFLPGAYAMTAGSLSPRVAPPIADANLTFAAAPSIAIPVGQLAWDNLSPVIFAPIAGQTTLAATLTTLIDCQSIGNSISNNGNVIISALGGAFTGVCNIALVAAAGAIEQAVKGLTLAGAQVDTVSAVLYDVSAARPQIDYTSDQIAEGVVTWKFSDTNIPSTLTAVRMYQ